MNIAELVNQKIEETIKMEFSGSERYSPAELKCFRLEQLRGYLSFAYEFKQINSEEYTTLYKAALKAADKVYDSFNE